MMNILLASAECAPLSKTGGLADVVGTLPKVLAKMDADARVITPMHKVIKDKYAGETEHVCDFWCDLGWRRVYVGIEKLIVDGVVIYLVDNESYFGGPIYRGGYLEGEQYSYFCRAVLESIPRLGFEPDIIHCNDWHTAMLPMLAKTQYPDSIMAKARYLLTIHNIAFQGWYDFGFVSDVLNVGSEYYKSEYIENFGVCNYLKAGCVFSDKINTVSPTYAEEILTPAYCEGLGGILNERKADLSGIINGIDTDVFNPTDDKLIAAEYSTDDMAGKAECKKALQEKMGLEINDKVPVVAMVTRMTEQKGFNLILQILDELMAETDMQFMLLGSGDHAFEEAMRNAEKKYPGRVCAYIGYNEALSHQVYAGSDFYLMPSRFEPCGLSQMIAMRYGTIPIVRETGGLKDTVIPYNKFTGEGTGFTFTSYYSVELKEAILRALECYGNDDIMNGLRTNAMGADFSFDMSAQEYMRLYKCMK